MIDTFQYKSPFGYIGVLADKLFLEKYMKAFIASRADELKKLLRRWLRFIQQTGKILQLIVLIMSFTFCNCRLQ